MKDIAYISVRFALTVLLMLRQLSTVHFTHSASGWSVERHDCASLNQPSLLIALRVLQPIEWFHDNTWKIDRLSKMGYIWSDYDNPVFHEDYPRWPRWCVVLWLVVSNRA